MFSFRTTPIEDQLDRALTEGRVACFCTQNCWDSGRSRYLYEIFRERGNLVRVIRPSGTELTPDTSHIDFSSADIEDVDAIVVEIQDVGSRYFNYTRDVMRLMSMCAREPEAPAIYVVDHINPAGRVVEGTIPAVESDIWTPRVAHRHGLTLGELCQLYYSEIGAKFPLHVISARCSSVGKDMLPWVIAPASDIPGMFTCELYSGGGLWNNTTISPAIGTARPYEYFGAPFIKTEDVRFLPAQRAHSPAHAALRRQVFAVRDERRPVREDSRPRDRGVSARAAEFRRGAGACEARGTEVDTQGPPLPALRRCAVQKEMMLFRLILRKNLQNAKLCLYLHSQ